jgi:hypothetical protein
VLGEYLARGRQLPTALDSARVADVIKSYWDFARRVLRQPSGAYGTRLDQSSRSGYPVENLWHYVRSHYWSNRSYADYDALLDAGTEAYRRLTPELLRSVCRCAYIESRAD